VRRVAFALITLLLGQSALASSDKLSNPAQEARAVELQKQLRCLVCQGESLDESEAPLAADLRHLIRERLAAGDSDAAVKHFLVVRYGDFILMKPPIDRETYLLWFGPLALILLGGTVVVMVAFKAHGRLNTSSGQRR
jgi:cytochrome c-type biogenesis protein CcmH